MALLSRAAVLFGILPVLIASRLSPDVSLPYKTVILWGGLRGAATLALALAVTEHPGIAPEVKRFVGVVATGFVLFTLMVQGTTLRPLMRWLGLDRLTPLESALREHAVALVSSQVRGKVEQAVTSFGLTTATADRMSRGYLGRLRAVQSAESGIALTDRIGLALAAMTSRESEIILAKQSELLIGTQNAGSLLAEARRILDATRAGGAEGYAAAAREALAFPWQVRLAHWLYRLFGYEAALGQRLADRFERLVASRTVIEELRSFPQSSIAPLLGPEAAAAAEAMLRERLDGVLRELDALRLQYPSYAENLYGTLLVRSGLRMEEAECNRLYEEGLIGLEVRRAMFEQIAEVRAQTLRRPMLDLHLDTRELARAFPLFGSFSKAQLDSVERLLTPFAALPGQVIIRKGERGDACFFIASGAVEVDTGATVLRLGRGDFFGELALLTGRPRGADVRAIAYCSLLRLSSRDFSDFLNMHPELRAELESVAEERMRANAASARETRAAPDS